MPKKKKNKKKIKKIKILKSEKKNIQVQKSGAGAADEKVQIKKIKKQPTEKKQYNVNQFVVYPKHGVGKILSIDKAVVGDISIQFY